MLRGFGGERDDKAHVGAALGEQAGGGKIGGGERAHFGFPAAGQEGDEGGVCVQFQGGAGSGAVGFKGKGVCQRVTNVGGGDAGALVDFGFAGEQTKNVRDGGADFFDAPATPRPDGGADEMHGGNTGGFQAGFQREVEVGRVDADEQVGRRGQQALPQAGANGENFGGVTQGVDKAVDGERFKRVQAGETLRLHERAANAEKFGVRVARAQGGEQVRGEQVAGGFSGNQCDAQRGGHDGRAA